MFYMKRNIKPIGRTIDISIYFPYIKPCELNMKVIWLPCASIIKSIVSLKEAVSYIWHIIIIIVVPECTHDIHIYLIKRQHIVGN